MRADARARVARAAANSLVACVAALAAGCGGGDDTQAPADPAIGLTDAAWALFEAGSLAAARDGFRDALSANSGYADAHNGLGWSLALDDSISAAYTAFSIALTSGLAGGEAFAGRSVVRGEPPLSDLAGAIGDAGSALARAPRFLFEHDATIDWRDLRLIRAQAYLAINRPDSAAAEVESLGGSRLPAEDPLFLDSLVAEIERLSGIEEPAKRPAGRVLLGPLHIATQKAP